MIKLYQGDSFKLIENLKDESVDLVQTDVPYPDLEIHDGKTEIIPGEEWISWFAPMADEINRVLKPGGSFVTTINSKWDFSFYHRWVKWMCDEYDLTYVYNWYWVKFNGLPYRLKKPVDLTDFIAHFYKGSIKDSKEIYNMDAIEDWTKYNPHTKLATNLIYSSTMGEKEYRKACKELGIKHSGKYPSLVADMFIRLLTKEGDVILEPFNGSGTTSIVASQLDRKCIAFEYNGQWVDLAEHQYKQAGLKYKVVRK
jgi:site-specific DNA-methyltransferase (adenine-specific)